MVKKEELTSSQFEHIKNFIRERKDVSCFQADDKTSRASFVIARAILIVYSVIME